MLHLLIIALATFTAITAVRSLLPVTLPTRIMPVLVTGVAYGLELVPRQFQHEILAGAVAGLVAGIHRMVVVQDIGPLPLPKISIRIPQRRQPPEPYRDPRIGNRIPRL